MEIVGGPVARLNAQDPLPALLTTGGGHCSTGKDVGWPEFDGLQEGCALN